MVTRKQALDCECNVNRYSLRLVYTYHNHYHYVSGISLMLSVNSTIR